MSAVHSLHDIKGQPVGNGYPLIEVTIRTESGHPFPSYTTVKLLADDVREIQRIVLARFITAITGEEE